MRLVFQSYPLQAALKEMVAAITGDPAWRVLLPPNQPLTTAERAELATRLRALPQMQPVLRMAA